MPAIPANQPAVAACISAWKSAPATTWQQIALNVEAETVPCDADWEVLFTTLAAAIATTPDPTEAWVRFCRSHQCHGPRHPVPLPAVLGRAVRLVPHATQFAKDVGLTPEEFQNLLEDAALAGPALGARAKRMLRSAALGRHLMWGTFCRDHPDESPFAHLPRTLSAIRAALGLGGCAQNETMVLFSYGTAGLTLFRPTVVDAADSPWYRPHADPTLPYGMTYPLNPNPERLAAQPEVVHTAVTGANLVFPLYLVV